MVPRKSGSVKSRSAPKPPKMRINAILGMRVPSEVRIVGVLVLLLAALYVFQLISQPSFLKSQVKGVTGLVVADSEKETGSTSQQAQVAATAAATATGTVQKAPQQPQQQPKPASATTPITLVSPAKGSAQSTPFEVGLEISEDVLSCYYLVKDNGAITWDRRTKPCKTTFTVAADYCKAATAAEKTCYVYVEAADSNGNIIGSDTAYYSIK